MNRLINEATLEEAIRMDHSVFATPISSYIFAPGLTHEMLNHLQLIRDAAQWLAQRNNQTANFVLAETLGGLSGRLATNISVAAANASRRTF